MSSASTAVATTTITTEKKNLPSNPNYIVEIDTAQSSAFKTLIEALKEIITETNIDFLPNGIRIVSANPSSTILVCVKLEAENFEKYYCKHKFSAGVLMINFFKIVRVLSGNDTLKLFIEEGNNHQMGVRIENADKNTVTTYYMNLIDVDHTQFNIPPIEFSSIITMPSNEFNKICRDMHNIGNVIEIKSIDNHLMFSCQGSFATQETIMGEQTNGLNFVKSASSSEIIQGYYNLDHLILFTKCTNLSPSVEILMKNNYLIIFSFLIGSLGQISLALSPKASED